MSIIFFFFFCQTIHTNDHFVLKRGLKKKKSSPRLQPPTRPQQRARRERERHPAPKQKRRHPSPARRLVEVLRFGNGHLVENYPRIETVILVIKRRSAGVAEGTQG